MPLRLEPALPGDTSELARLRTAVAERLTERFGPGHWSSPVSEVSQASAIEQGRVFVARRRESIVATLRLATKKPWAIDGSYFTKVTRPLYLTDMAVAPDVQRRGIGRACMAEAGRIARQWPADAIRLDAYDAAAGAGPFYEKCGLREMGRVVYRNDPLIYYEWLLADWPALEGRLS
jgi:GNAT superfamily N-acetyltransferase